MGEPYIQRNGRFLYLSTTSIEGDLNTANIALSTLKGTFGSLETDDEDLAKDKHEAVSTIFTSYSSLV